MLPALLVLSSAISLVFFLRCCWLFGSAKSEILNLDKWENKNQEVDIAIFRGLLDRDDCHYLRKTLQLAQFRALRRKRIHLALRMLRAIEENADLLMEVAKAAKRSDLVRQQQAEELIEKVFKFRLNLLRARFCLLLQWFFPSWVMPLPAFAALYAQLQNSLVRYQRYGLQQHPSQPR